MYAIVFFDRLEYRHRPLFRDRDNGVIVVWETAKEAEEQSCDLYHPLVVNADLLPFAQFNQSAASREWRPRSDTRPSALDAHLAMGGSEPD